MDTLQQESLPGLRILDAARTLGTRVIGEPGSGKSVMLAAGFSYPDQRRGIPSILWDVNGGLIDAHWALVLDQSGGGASGLLDRIRYVDVGNPDYAYGRPFYYWNSRDDAFAVAQRPLDVFMKLNPSLSEAPILGEPSLKEIGAAAGMIAAAISDGQSGNWQVTEAIEALLHYKDAFWARLMDQVEPTVPAAVRFFRDSYGQWDKELQRNRRWAFEGRCWPFVTSRTLRAIVGQGRPGIDWEEVVRKGLCVMLDFRRLQDKTVRDELCLLWLQSLIEFIERRGIHESVPLSIIFDEVPALLENPAVEPEVSRLINRYRAMKVWSVVAHQSLSQLSPRLREAMWSFGNQIIGKQLGMDACLEIARNMVAFDPYRIRWPAPSPEQLPQAMPLTDQEHELANWLQRREGRQFLVRRYYDEETPDTSVRFIARTPDIPALRRIRTHDIEQAKAENLKRFARPVEEVLREIDARIPTRTAPQQERPKL